VTAIQVNGKQKFAIKMSRASFRHFFKTTTDQAKFVDYDVLPTATPPEFGNVRDLDELLGGSDWRFGENRFVNLRVAGMLAKYSAQTGNVTFSFGGNMEARSFRNVLLTEATP